MNLLENLIVLYAGTCLLNAILSAALWARSRTQLHRSLFIVWVSTMLSLAAQALLNQNDLAVTAGFSSVFLANLALAALIARISHQQLATRWYVGFWLASLGVSALAYSLDLSFAVVSLPTALSVAAPISVVGVRALATRRKTMSFTGKGLTVSGLFFVVHNLDFPFLGDKPDIAPIAISVAIVIIFALSIFAPAVVLEIVTQQESRVRAEMDVAARIQTEILPAKPHVTGLELECYMRPADAVGGDYYDIVNIGDVGWILVGDVTGHGLGSGLVMLMAQSIISAVLHTQEDISPRRLNALANRVLYNSLQRLHEDRTMTIVSLCYNRKTKEFVVSGSHDDIYVYRAKTGTVEVVEMMDFPFGLGFLEDLQDADITEHRLTLDSGDLLFIGTDGVTEAAEGGDHRNGLFDSERLMLHLQRVGRAPLEEIKDSLLADLERFTNGVYHDDITFVMARVQEDVHDVI